MDTIDSIQKLCQRVRSSTYPSLLSFTVDSSFGIWEADDLLAYLRLQLIWFAFHRCRVSEDLCRISIVFHGSHLEGSAPVRISSKSPFDGNIMITSVHVVA